MISAVLCQFLAGPYRGTGSYSDPTLVARTVAFGLSGGNLRTFIQLPMVRGVYTLAGNNVTLTPIWHAGSYTLVGGSSGLGIALPAGSNAFAFTGNAATLLKPATGDLAGSVGQFLLAGRSATNALAAPLGSAAFAMTGRAAGDAVGIPASVGTFALTGYAASYSIGLPANSGTFALTGNAATINTGHGLLAGSGTFALTGRVAAIVHVGKLADGAGSFSLTGNAAALTNPTIWNSADKASGVALSGGGLTASYAAGGTNSNVRATHTRGAGKYFEVIATALTISSGNSGVGLANSSASLAAYLGSDSTNAVGWFADGWVQGPGVAGHFAPLFDVGDVLGVELLSSSIKVYKNGTLAWTFTTLPSGSLYPAVTLYNAGDSLTANFGASSLSHLPSGDTSWDG